MKLRYNKFSAQLKERFDGRTHKISIDAGFTCPNRSNDRSQGGCIFCDATGSGSTGIAHSETIAEQIEQAKGLMIRKYKAKKFIAYFQPFSNTNAPVDVLRQCYDEALSVSDVVGLAIGTRPDCVDAAVINLLEEYHQRTYLWLELGLQSIHNKTLDFIQRGHDYATFLRTYEAAKKVGIRVCVHIILGLPGESHADILETAREMSRLGVDGVKLHLLHILRGTELGRLYQQGDISVLTKDEYISLVVDVIEVLGPDISIQRLTGDGPRSRLLAPEWSIKKWEVLNGIEAELERRDSWQGKCWGDGCE